MQTQSEYKCKHTGTECDSSHTAIENGRAMCTNDNLHGSICVFYCNTGYDLIGDREGFHVCDNGQFDGWNYEKPFCQGKSKRV